MFSKKGMAENIKNILLFLAGFIMIILILVPTFSTAEGILKHKMCTWSLIFKDKFLLGPNLCYTDDDVIKSNDKKEVIEDVTDRMVECWKRMGESEIAIESNVLFGNYNCFKCYRVKFEGLKDEITYKEFYDYLIKTEYEKDNYYNFFKKYDPKNEIILSGLEPPSEDLDEIFIDPNQYYGIAFKGYSGIGGTTKIVQVISGVKIGALFGSIPGALIGGGISVVNVGIDTLRGEFKEDAIIVAPYNKIGNYCSDTI